MAQITEGQKDWKTPINDFMSTNAITVISDWSSEGITYKNGCTASTDTANRIQYNLVQMGSIKVLRVVGWVSVPKLAFDANVDAFTIPTSITNQVNKYGLLIGSERNSWGDLLVAYSLNMSTGTLSIHNKNSRGDGSADASSYMVDYGVIC